MRMVIAARKSDLARIQAYNVGESLQKKYPDLHIDYHFRESLGDINLNDPLWKMPEKGVFTEDFHAGLLNEEWDLVVHSWKDLPVEDKIGTELAATLEREDARDLLLFKKSSLKKYKDSKNADLHILTSSPRRSYNLKPALPRLLPFKDCAVNFDPVRGNIQTRVRKLLEGTADGLVLAKAALDRLLATTQDEFAESRTYLREALTQLQWTVMPLSLNPTAAAQGALAVEIKIGRKVDGHDLKALLAKIHHEPTYLAVQEERRQLKSYGGGCHQKIGISILDKPYGRLTFSKGIRDSGEVIDVHKLENSVKVKSGKTFPASVREAPVWFDRRALDANLDISQFTGQWVTKAEALPQDLKVPPEHVIWTSGLKTWMRLAERGLWVNGSADSMGEHEDERIDTLFGRPVDWCKWTHVGGSPSQPRVEKRKSYELIARAEQPVLPESAVHFFWMSGSAFLQALKLYPWLINKENWCGPGHTFEVLSREIKSKNGLGAAHIALNFEEWQKKCNSRDV